MIEVYILLGVLILAAWYIYIQGQEMAQLKAENREQQAMISEFRKSIQAAARIFPKHERYLREMVEKTATASTPAAISNLLDEIYKLPPRSDT